MGNLNYTKLFGLLSVCCVLASACTDTKKQAGSIPSGASSEKLDYRKLESLGSYPNPLSQEDAEASGSNIDVIDEDSDINSVLPQCGVSDLSDRNRKTFATTMAYSYTRVIDAGIAKANVDLSTTLFLNGTLAQTTLDVKVLIDKVSGTSSMGEVIDTTAITATGENIAKKFRGPVTSYSAANNSNFSKDWKGIVCTIPGSTSLRNTRDGRTTEVKFYPAYAPNISPIADRVRYEKELGDYRFFKNIKATVTATDNPLLTTGKEYVGTILVEKIPSERMTPIGKFQGDTAYRVTNHFGSEEETLALGMHLWTEYYIDHGQRSFSAIIANVGDDDLMYFKGTYIGEAAQPSGPTYLKNMQALLTKRCTSCHNSTAGSRLDLSTYEKVKASSALVLERVQAGTMPPSAPLNSEEKALLKSWVDGGLAEK